MNVFHGAIVQKMLSNVGEMLQTEKIHNDQNWFVESKT